MFMKRFLYIIICIVALPFSILAQQQEYNRKGDDAMKRKNFRNATMWYEEGVMNCDAYSIKQLTTIWQQNERMRPSMRGLMNKCFICLQDKATIENDSTAMSQLILYYREGIGTLANEEQARNWSNRLEELRRPVVPVTYETEKVKAPREPMKFFLGYNYSMEAPFGLTVGGVGRRFGWYARFKTNMSFDSYTNECIGEKELLTPPSDAAYRFTNEQKTNMMAASAGLVIKCAPWLYTTVGAGYGQRELLCEYTTISYADAKKQETLWAKNNDYSYNGVVAEIDFMVKMGPMFISAGCHTISFKYIDLNAGVGVFF